MKKTFARVLSLILVLVTLIGVLPMVSAEEISDFGAGTVKASASSTTVKAGKPVTLTATVPYDSALFRAPTVEWHPEDPGIGTVKKDSSNPMKATFVPNQIDGDVSIVMVATCKEIESGVNFTVTKRLSVTVESTDAEPKPGPDAGTDEEEVVITYSVQVEPATLKLAVGEVSEALKVVVKKQEGEKETVLSASDYDVEWLTGKVDGKVIVSVDDSGKVTGVAEGRTAVEACVVLKGEDAERTAICDVTVGDAPVDEDEDDASDDKETGDSDDKFAGITSRGVVLGTVHSKSIADDYKENTGKELGYVIFDLPAAKYGKLHSKLAASASSANALSATDKVWYKSSRASDLKLSDVAFIPAAGFKSTVALAYTAYDASGSTQYKGKLLLNVTVKSNSAVFSDVTAARYSWAADSVDFLYYQGITQGSNGKFNPASNITRRDFMLMLYRAFLAKDYSTFDVTTNFPDVVKGADAYSQEIYQAVGVAKMLGIAQGSNDKFNPKDNITRQEAMVLIYRTLDVINKDLGYTVAANITAFRDYSKISGWAVDAITYLVNHGVIQGSNEKINPTSNITRAEMACILHRVLTY